MDRRQSNLSRTITRWPLAVASVWMGLIASGLLGHNVAQADEPVAPTASPPGKPSYSADGLMAAADGAKFLGTRSCAATACHGNLDADPRYPLSRRNEYPFWLERDPHARAYLTLDNAKSQAILARLARPNETAAEADRRRDHCAACHNPQPPPSQQSATFFQRDGVSCEICHGAAEKWIGAHVAPDWSAVKQNPENQLGFIDTEDLVVRAKSCAQCHVGSADREVNHDLIAAGHPVLKFELAAYHDMLPKHWRDAAARTINPNLEVDLWSAGQVASADAALALLDWRADGSADKHPDAAWPELAEYDCFACHHDLQAPSWRRKRSLPDLPLGLPAWGTWYFGPLRQVTGPTDDAAMQEVARHLAAVAGEMQRGFGNEAPSVRKTVKAAREQLAPLVRSTQLRKIGDQLHCTVKSLVDDQGGLVVDSPAQPAGWDHAVQLYLAIVAIDHADRRIGTRTLADTRALFAFPESPYKYNSPRGFFAQQMPGTLTSDPNHGRSRQEILAALVKLIQQLEPCKD